MGFQEVSLPGKNIRGDQGFTLIELMLMILFTTVALLDIANMLYTTLEGNKYSKQMTLAVGSAQEKIEEFRDIGYVALPKTSSSDTPVSGLSRSWSVVDNSPAVNMASVTVTVSWSGFKGSTRTITLNTIISQ